MNENTGDTIDLETQVSQLLGIFNKSINCDEIRAAFEARSMPIKSIRSAIESIRDLILARKVGIFIGELKFKNKAELEEFERKYLRLPNKQQTTEKVIHSLTNGDDEEIKQLAKEVREKVGKA